MLKQTLVVLNEMVYGTTSVYTSPVYDDVLGRFDKIAIQYIATDVGGTGTLTLTVAIEGSNDRRNWLAMTGTPPISAKVIATGQTNCDWGQTTTPDSPFLSYLRLKITLGGTTPAARVKLLVTARDNS